MQVLIKKPPPPPPPLDESADVSVVVVLESLANIVPVLMLVALIVLGARAWAEENRWMRARWERDEERRKAEGDLANEAWRQKVRGDGSDPF